MRMTTKKKTRAALAFLLAVLLLFPQFSALADGERDALTVGFYKETETITFLKADGVTPLEKNGDGQYILVPGAKMAVAFSYSLAENVEYDFQAGDYIPISELQEAMEQLGAFAAFTGLTREFTATLDDGRTITTGNLQADGKILLHSDIAKQDGITYSGTISGTFNIEKIIQEKSKPFTVELGDNTYTFVPPARNPSVALVKSGTYNATSKQIDWTITMMLKETNGENATLTDNFGDSQAYVTGSFKVKTPGASAGETTAPTSVLGNVLTHTFKAPIYTTNGTNVYVFTYSTTPTSFPPKQGAAWISEYKNSATAKLEGGPSAGPAVGKVELTWISKAAGNVDFPNGLNNYPVIPWTVTLNNYKGSMAGQSVTDTLPEGLVLVDSTVKLGNTVLTTTVSTSAAYYTYDGSCRKLEVIFPAGATQYTAASYNITFNTKVTDPTMLTSNTASFKNTATLSFGGDSGIVTGKEITKGIGNGIIDKQVKSPAGTPDYKHHSLIEWQIAANKNNINISNPVITDTLPAGIELVRLDGSAVVPYASGATLSNFFSISGYVGTVDISYNTTTREITFKIGTTENPVTIQQALSISFRTRTVATASQLTASGNGITVGNYQSAGTKDVYKQVTFTNTVSLTGKHGETDISSSDTANQAFKSQLLGKSVPVAYDYSSRLVTWELTVNRNKTPLTYPVKVVDTLPAGMVIKEGTFVYTKNEVDLNEAEVAELGTLALTRVSEDSPYTGFTFTFNDPVSDTYTIRFVAEVTEVALQRQATPLSFENNATLYQGETVIGTATSTIRVQNPIIQKGLVASATENEAFANWSVVINHNLLDLKGVEVEDTLESYFELDVASVKLYTATVTWDGSKWNAVKGDPVTLVKDDLKYEGKTFKLKLPNGSQAYILEFTTDVTIAKLAGVSNTIKLTGKEFTTTQSVVTNASFSFDNNIQSSASNGRLTFKKVGTDGQSLVGVKFRLADQFGGVKEAVSGSDGTVTFEQLRYRVYTLTEIETVNNHLLSKGSWTVKPTSANRDITLDNVSYNSEIPNSIGIIQNELAVGSITFYKYDDNKDIEKQKPLAGAEFTLFDADGENPILKDGKNWTATSGADGKVEFTGVPLGTYIIKETRPPAGYYRSDKTLTVTLGYKIVDDKVDQSAVENVKYDYDQIENRYTNKPVPAPSLGAILIVKSDAVDQTPLAGATFTLYSALTGNVLTSVTTGPDGKALFADLLPGSYLVKETEAPQGYILSVTEKTVTVISGGTSSLLITNEKKPAETTTPPAETTVPPYTGGGNSDNVGEIRLKKIGKDGAALAGATLTLFNESGEVVAVKTSGADGLVTFADLPLGTYYLEETSAPDGYLLPSGRYTIALTEETAVCAFYFRNTMPGDPDQPGLTEIPDGEIPADKSDPPETGTGTVVVPETPGELPKTGGFRSYAMPIGIMLLVLAAGLIAAIAMRKKI